MSENSKIVNQLRTLVALTQTEEQIARTRVGQARTEAVARELRQNADNAVARTQAIVEELRALGGVPDVVTPATGRVTAVVKATVEQAQPLEEALLGDLALEHQLLDRATYLKALAETSDNAGVRRLAERLMHAHQATVEWLTVVLAEEALGGPAALQPTPLQRVAGTTVRVANAPYRLLADRVNKTVDDIQQRREKAGERLQDVKGQVEEFGGAVRETMTAGRAASLRRAEKIARREGNRDAAETARHAREELGDISASELPIKGFDSLSTADAVAAIKKLSTPHDVEVMIRYEETHKNRTNVANAAQTQLAAIAKQTVGVSS